MRRIIHYNHISYIAYPQLIGFTRNEVFNEVRVSRKTMRGVGCTRFPDSQTDLEIVLVDYSAEAIPPYRIVAAKLGLVHVPKLRATYPRIKFADVFDVLQCELLPGSFCEGRILVVLIIGLLAYAKQLAKELDAIASMILCVQVSYCLAPAFFRIGILNLASATLIISSYASALISALRSCASSSLTLSWSLATSSFAT